MNMVKSMNLKYTDLLKKLRDIIKSLVRRKNVSNYERMTNEELLSTPPPHPPPPPQKKKTLKNN